MNFKSGEEGVASSEQTLLTKEEESGEILRRVLELITSIMKV